MERQLRKNIAASLLLGLVLSSCVSVQVQPTATPTLAPMPTPTNLFPLPPNGTPPPSPSPLPAVTLAPSDLPSASASLGSAVGPRVPARPIVLERFANGVMIVFAKSDQGFAPSGGEFIFALVKDGRAWRIADTFVQKSGFADDWYTCDRAPGQRPEKSGVPWRGFGKAWCEHPEVRAALGRATGYEEAEITASFQSFERGRSFQVSEWRGIPGWDKNRVYTVYLNSADSNFTAGRWD